MKLINYTKQQGTVQVGDIIIYMKIRLLQRGPQMRSIIYKPSW